MKLCLWFAFLCLLLFFSNTKEPLTIRVDTDKIHDYAFLPAYRALLGLVPFKYQYRKARQYFKS